MMNTYSSRKVNKILCKMLNTHLCPKRKKQVGGKNQCPRHLLSKKMNGYSFKEMSTHLSLKVETYLCLAIELI